MPTKTFNATTNNQAEQARSAEAQELFEHDAIYAAAFETLDEYGPEALILAVNSLYMELRKTHDSIAPIIEDILDAANLAIMSHNGQPDKTSKQVTLITCDIFPKDDQSFNINSQQPETEEEYAKEEVELEAAEIGRLQAYTTVALYAEILNNAKSVKDIENIRIITETTNDMIREHGAGALTMSMMTLNHQMFDEGPEVQKALAEIFTLSRMSLVHHEQKQLNAETTTAPQQEQAEPTPHNN